MSNKPFTDLPEFAALQRHHADIAPRHMRDMFKADPSRFEKFSIQAGGILLDYSRHRATEETMKLLHDLALACGIEQKRDEMFSGVAINNTEKRAALHVALRGSVDKALEVEGENVSAFVDQALKKIKNFSEKIRGEKKITDIVNLGIGGSDLGTRTVYEALGGYADGPRVHFVPNIDGVALTLLLEKLNPDKTLFAVVSKSFTTHETMLNAHSALQWLKGRPVKDHFIAVTENEDAARAFGVTPEHIFPLRKWVGGRTSIWGAVGLPVAIAIGFDNFQKFLDGARAMDEHFKSAPLLKNMPVIMALLGVWYRNFFDFRAHTAIAYAQGLRTFHAYLQQLDMESNGKNIDRAGNAVDYETGPVIFGEPGTNAQHAFFQALHQGTDVTPCDLIIAASAEQDIPAHRIPLNANALAQAKALMEGHENKAEPHRHYQGNRPSSMIVLDKLDPYHLGMLLALYEHKVFVQGLIWNINSFDQWGVELGKNLAREIIQALENKEESPNFDSSTRGLLRHINSRG